MRSRVGQPILAPRLHVLALRPCLRLRLAPVATCGPRRPLGPLWPSRDWLVYHGGPSAAAAPDRAPATIPERPCASSPYLPRSPRMPEITLTAEAGRETGSSSTRRLRAEGKIPGVVYGHGSEPIPVAVVAREFQIAMSGEAGLNTLLSLEVTARTIPDPGPGHPAPPVPERGHPRRLPDRAPGRGDLRRGPHQPGGRGRSRSHHGDGIVDQQLFTLHIKAKPADIPPSVDIDISELTIGAALHVSDITIPRGVELETDLEATVVGRPASPGADDGRRGGRDGRGGRGRRGGDAGIGGRHRVRRGLSPAPPTASTGAAPRTGTPVDLLVVGLGNPGAEYVGTRHNIGAEVAAALAERHNGRLKSEKGLRALACEIRIGDDAVLVAVPLTYMNESGLARGPAGPAGRHRPSRPADDDAAGTASRLIVVHDELDLPSGRVKVKVGRRHRRQQRAQVDRRPPPHRRLPAGPGRHRQASRSPVRGRLRARSARGGRAGGPGGGRRGGGRRRRGHRHRRGGGGHEPGQHRLSTGSRLTGHGAPMTGGGPESPLWCPTTSPSRSGA